MNTLLKIIHWFINLIVCLLLLFVLGCSKNDISDWKKEVSLTITITSPRTIFGTSTFPPTKSAGSTFSNNTLCNTIRSIDVIVFDYPSGTFEKIQRFSDAWNRSTNLPSSTTISNRTFTININEGLKEIIVIANSQHTKQELSDYYSGVSSQCKCLIEKEFPGVYTMYGKSSAPITISGNTSTSISISKLVSRIIVNSIKNSYRDASNVNVYLTSACGSTTITSNGIVSENGASLSQEGIALGKSIVGNSYTNNNHLSCRIGTLYKGNSYSGPIYLYCYPKNTGGTKLMISGQFMYTITFFPIEFRSLVQNTSYVIDIIDITRAGNPVDADLPLYYIDMAPTKSKNGENICKIDKIVL